MRPARMGKERQNELREALGALSRERIQFCLSQAKRLLACAGKISVKESNNKSSLASRRVEIGAMLEKACGA